MFPNTKLLPHRRRFPAHVLLPAIGMCGLALAIIWVGLGLARTSGPGTHPWRALFQPFDFVVGEPGDEAAAIAVAELSTSEEAARAKRLRQEGAYEEAAALYHSLLDRPPTELETGELALAAAESYLAAGANTAASTMARRALDGSPARSEAKIVQAEAMVGLGRVDEARDLFQQAMREDGIGGYAAFRAAEVADADGYPVAATQLFARAIELGVNKWWEAAAARRIGRQYVDAGDFEDAVTWLNRAAAAALVVEQRANPVWFDGELVQWNRAARRPPILLDLARALRLNEEREAATATLVSIVQTHPTTTEARDALDALVERGGVDRLSSFERGLVLFHAGRAAAAIEAFTDDLSSSGPPDGGTVRYYLGLARRNNGDTAGAIGELTAMARAFPRHDLAPDALWQAARLTENRGSGAEKLAAYLAVARAFPGSDAAGRALMRIGSLYLADGDEAAARDAWGHLARSGGSANARAQGLFWLGRSLLGLGSASEGKTTLEESATTAPFLYEGIRARDLVEGGLGAEPFARRWDLRMDIPTDDAVVCAQWIATWADADSPGTVAARAITRIDKLLSVGQREAALAEALEASAESDLRPYDLHRLAVAFGERTLYPASIHTALRLGAKSPARSAENGPPCLQRLAYPVPFPHLIAAEARYYGLDPLYLTALLRQESWFGSHALSGAQARGMSQVIPATRRGIAQALGRPGMTDDDLYRPRVAITFGAYYLDETYKALGMRPLVALAGYNAGPGAARRWTGGNPRIDADAYVEAIDYSETRTYVRSIYQGYARYRSLY